MFLLNINIQNQSLSNLTSHTMSIIMSASVVNPPRRRSQGYNEQTRKHDKHET